MIKVKTEYPIAFDSPDHTHPWGTTRDNSSSGEFIGEILRRFSKKINFLDLGCSGGRLVRDFIEHANYSIGLEGSDYSVKNQRAEWPDLYNTNLFTCDVSRPFEITDKNDNLVLFDCITAWEVVEHIHPDRLDIFFLNIWRHLHPAGLFCCSISTKSDQSTGVELHQSKFDEAWWNDYFYKKGFFLEVKPSIQNRVRSDEGSFQKTFAKNENLNTKQFNL